MGPTDQDLLAAYQAGSLNAFETLYARCAGALLTYALGMLGDRNDAEDVLQYVFAAFVKRAPLLPADTSVRRYLFASARNRIANMRRNRDRASHFASNYEVFVRLRDGQEQHPVAGPETEEMRQKLNGALARLSDDEREVVLLHTQGDLSFTEVADALAVPRGTVAGRYRGAILKLREMLNDEQA